MNEDHQSNAPRDPRCDAPVVTMDLSRRNAAIERDLQARFGDAGKFWWELETDLKSGWVYDSASYILAKLVHVAKARQTRNRLVKAFTLSLQAVGYIERVAAASGRSHSAIVEEAIRNHQSVSTDEIDKSLAFAVRAASEAGQWSLVAQLASELEARQTVRAMS